MSLRAPDARGRRVLMSAELGEAPPSDPLERALYGLLRGEPATEESDAVSTAYDLYLGPEHHVLDALLLIRADEAEIRQGLGLNEATLTAYRTLFFDTSVFQHAFAVRRHIRAIPDDHTPEYASYELALTEGATALLDNYRVGEPPELDPLKVAAASTRELASRMREHRGRPLTSKTAQLSLKAAREAAEIAKLQRDLAPKNTRESQQRLFSVLIAAEEHTLSAEQAPVDLSELVREGPPVKKT